jgi:membrane fusion protein, heavy metal efflux system
MKKSDALAAVGGLALLAVGFGGIVVAEKQGWLGDSSAESQACPHSLKAEKCPFCTPDLIEKLGPCGEHGVPEAFCTRCNDSLIPAFKAKFDWCGEHAVPESQCVICDPSRAPKGQQATPPPQGAVSLVPREDLPRTARAPSTKCSTETLRVQFLSSEVARDAGLAYVTVAERKVPFTLTCTAEVDYDRNQYARVAPRAPGVLSSVLKDLGDRVSQGDRLAVVTSTELGSAKAELLQARTLEALWVRNDEREQRLLRQRVSTERDVLQAETELAKARVAVSGARQRLRNLGISGAEIAAVCSSQDTSAALSVTAPFAGTVVARDAVEGEVVRTDRPLFAVADTRTLWAMLDVQEADIHRVRVGQPIVLAINGLPGETFPGRVTWVSAEVDRRTRTLRARAEVANADGVLRAGMFGRAVVHVSGPEQRVVVPKEAVQWEGCCNVVFVRKNDRLFEPRKVRLGHEAGPQWVVESGLSAGETVVTTGSFLLKTEILKGSIGAGCCEVEPAR